jgi:branched-subunit amino acid transport protein AzlD
MPSFVFTVIVVAAGVIATRTSAIYWQMAFCLFGATAALTLPNGAVITPSNFFLPFLILRAWSENHGTRYIKRVPAAGVWLGLAALCGVVAAWFVPRYLQGELVILTVDRQGTVSKPALYPLQPVSTNFTQSVYAIGGVLVDPCVDRA